MAVCSCARAFFISRCTSFIAGSSRPNVIDETSKTENSTMRQYSHQWYTVYELHKWNYSLNVPSNILSTIKTVAIPIINKWSTYMYTSSVQIFTSIQILYQFLAIHALNAVFTHISVVILRWWGHCPRLPVHYQLSGSTPVWTLVSSACASVMHWYHSVEWEEHGCHGYIKNMNTLEMSLDWAVLQMNKWIQPLD